MSTEAYTFSNRHVRLAGTLSKPDTSPPYPCVIVLHAASGGTRAFPFYQHLATRLPERGIAVLLFDRRGSGESTGDFETSDFDDLAQDGAAAFDALSTHRDIGGAHIFLYGISQGGWIAPLVAALRPAVAGLVIVSGSGVSPARQMDFAASYTLREGNMPDALIARALALRQHVNEYYRGERTRKELQAEIARVQDEPWFEMTYMDKSENIAPDVTQDKWYYEMDHDPLAVWHTLQVPALFIFPGHDRWVPVDESMSNFRAATTHLQDVTFAQIPGADHLMSEVQGDGQVRISDTYVDRLCDWLGRHGRHKLEN